MFKTGIIGCGGIAMGKHLPSLEKLKDVTVVAFCDIIENRAADAKEKYGSADAHYYTDYREMLEKEDLDVIHVCTPNSSHAEISIAAMEAGCHVMCEKPMAKTYREAKAMLEAHHRTGKKLTIGYQNRFKAGSLYLKEACENDELGEIYFAKAHALRRRGVPTWGVFLDKEQQGGGPLIDIGTHSLDLTLWMMDNYSPQSVSGSIYYKLGNQTRTGNPFGDWDPEKFNVEDSAFGYIKMKNGASIFLESSWALNIVDDRQGSTTLCGVKAGAELNNQILRFNQVEYGKMTMKEPDLSAGGVDFFDGKQTSPADLEARQWYDAIREDKAPVVLPEQALVVTQILEGIYESARTGKSVLF